MLSSRERKMRERERKRVEEQPRVPAATFFRMFVLGSLSIVAASYAIWRHYYVARPPMLVPAPAVTETPAPSIEVLPLADDDGGSSK